MTGTSKASVAPKLNGPLVLDLVKWCLRIRGASGHDCTTLTSMLQRQNELCTVLSEAGLAQNDKRT